MKMTYILLSILSFWLNISCNNTKKANNQATKKDTAIEKPVATALVETSGAAKETETAARDIAIPAVKKPLSPKKITKKIKGVNPGADYLVSEVLPMLEGKRVGIATNHTALLSDGTHLVDELQKTGVNVVKVFSPEHGFRGTADAGEKVNSSVDAKTGLPLVSLYGNNKKPTPEQLKDLDVVVFDIQDVGTRHYTYISTLSYIMEACAENGKAVFVLDRPNPNGWYVEGPMMQSAYTSFIGMHQVPIVHGMTIGEYAKMVNEEGWLKGGKKCSLSVIKCTGYTHAMRWNETGLKWIPPSPNMVSDYAAYLYPILCWYEATTVSVGRGTEEAFTILGAPWNTKFVVERSRNDQIFGLSWEKYDFTPRSLPGKAKNPPYQDVLCHGIKFSNQTDGKNLFLAGIALLEAFYQSHKASGETKPFFSAGLEKWVGNKTFQSQIVSNASPEEIYNAWQGELSIFKEKRKKYLLYP